MAEVTTVNEAFLLVTGRGEQVGWKWLDSSGTPEQARWHGITSAEMYGRVRAMATALGAWGVSKGDRVALISENRWEWPVVDFATLALGAVDVPLYLTLTAEQIGYMLRDSGAKVAVVSNWEQAEKIRMASEIAELPALERLVVMDEAVSNPTSLRDVGQPAAKKTQIPFGNDKQKEFAVPIKQMSELLKDADAMQARDVEFDTRAQAAKPEDLATIIYTSGTTGEPKGVMLTHGNLASNFSVSTVPFGFNERDSCISFLPLSHVTARHLDYALMCDGATLAYCPKFDLLPAAMKAVRPTIFVAVPRVYEKIRQGVEGKSHGAKKAILNWALGVGTKHRDRILTGQQHRDFIPLWILAAAFAAFVVASALDVIHRRSTTLVTWVFFASLVFLFGIARVDLNWRLANKLVFSKIRDAFGGRVRTFVAGGAPLGMDTAGWFADVGIRILEGYGLTETSPVIALNYPHAARIGTVGKLVPGVEVRHAADGEVEVRGRNIFPGYWNKPQETAESFTPDGWLKTGDIGATDADGFLSITDRKKELLKTSGGKLIAPQPIENKLKAHNLVGNAALVGDRHKFACVLISPNFAALEGWAKVHNIEETDRTALVRNPAVIARYQRIVDEVNATLAPFETMKRMAVVDREWSVEGDELTPSMKLKRRVVEKKHAAEIAEFYKDEATAAAG
ncbi:MAG TPA: long-chain fatty acid--CoA ligase [Acidobacteriaceae bacterium]|nr:long-chain fatty acid--CoA ligase [Acidobacteriaceae bacterium]